MDLRTSKSDEEFRAGLRAWLADNVGAHGARPGPEDWPGRRAYDTGWQRKLFEAGYAGVGWPVEYGGRGATPTEQLIYAEETERARAPYVGANFVGLLHAGPTLIAEGTEAQKQRHLPPILRGEQIWCQGFSEPGAGSDLAGLQTKATRDGDHYVVNGQKIWTSFAHIADFGELLVRTDPAAPKHKGITWLILDMKTPGIEVRPMRTIAGSTEFCEVFLTDVRIPIENRVGEENDGWRIAMVTFAFERGTAFVGELVSTREMIGRLATIARSNGRWGDQGIRRDLGRLAAELDALWALTIRNVTQAERTGVPGPLGSVFKLAYTEARHRLGDLALRVLGRAGLSLDDVDEVPGGEHVRGWIHAMSMSIAAGTTQVQRNIIGERILGLPKEPA